MRVDFGAMLITLSRALLDGAVVYTATNVDAYVAGADASRFDATQHFLDDQINNLISCLHG